MVMDPTLPRIKVRDLLMQAFLTGWERSDKSTSQDEYLQSSIQVIEMLQVEPENLYAEEGLGLPDGEEVDHLDDLLRADGFWLYYGVEAENFFLIQWYPDEASANAKLAQLEELELAYAITVHKSQGSEYPAVVIPLLQGPRMLYNRNLLYTAVTRAKKCLTIVGSEATFQEMIQNKNEQNRYTSLAECIRGF